MAVTNSGFIFSGGQMRTVTRVAATPTTIGNNSIVAAVSGLKIRVVSFSVSGMTAGDTVEFRSSTGTAISHALVLAANQVEWFGLNEHGWFETVAGEALTVQLTTGNDIGVLVNYITTI